MKTRLSLSSCLLVYIWAVIIDFITAKHLQTFSGSVKQSCSIKPTMKGSLAASNRNDQPLAVKYPTAKVQSNCWHVLFDKLIGVMLDINLVSFALYKSYNWCN